MRAADAILFVLLGAFAIVPLWSISAGITSIARSLERLANLAERRR